MNPFQNDTRDIELTPEFIEKSDKDLETIAALDSLASSTSNVLVLSGGYAVEAYCGGKIARPHGDIDANIILKDATSNEVIFQKIDSLLKNENVSWLLSHKKVDKVDYLEDANQKKFFDKRKLEIRLSTPELTNFKYPKKVLINSLGKKVEVYVVDLNQMIADKIRKLYELRGGVDTAKDRHTSISDLYDLNRLFELEELDKDALKKEIPDEYEYFLTLMAQFK